MALFALVDAATGHVDFVSAARFPVSGQKTWVDAGAAVPPPQACWIYADGVFAPPAPPAPSRADLLAYAADKRWRVETGGVTVAGVTVATSRDSQAMIANAYAYLVASGAPSIRFKAESGWVTLDVDALKTVALAVGAHVQAAFAVEDSAVAAIDAGSITTTAAIDALAWPA